ncbi:MSHA biogenesis protein MshI [Halorhodospira halochloris]|uniref:MSHA biogenesis protein MshI n=1 Tax=Halorhodospira halochloris TaxID=1052 RepID=A0A0X8XBZ7_HALHR|nr:PilN domain-containing protein [Halorhodospira halochloris]MBK1651103.1 hypothetical protein [Halorhodospira halochloris]BAU57369.1 MSHA biogenesis protein MshI [Halorhodospira halochloris]
MYYDKLKEWWQQESAQMRVGVHLAPRFVAITIVSADGSELISSDYLKSTPQTQEKALAELVERNDCAGSPAYVVLDGSDYEIRHIDAPQVPPAEIASALRFRLKDMVEIPFEQMAVAAQLQYSDRRQADHQIALAGIARQERIAAIARTVHGADLELQAVLMRETALSNLAAKMPAAEGGVAIVYVGDNDGVIAICRGSRLGLARRHNTGTEQIAAAHGNDQPLQSIATELQYSLDYHDGQLSSSPTSLCVVPPLNGSGRDRLIDHLDQALPIKSDRLNPYDLLQQPTLAAGEEGRGAPTSEPATQGHCLLALAAALPHPELASASMYAPERKRINPLGARALGAYLLGSIVLLALFSIVMVWRAAALEAQLATGEEQRQELTAAIATIKDERGTGEPDSDLIAKRDELERERELRTKFLEQIHGIEQEALGGFSQTLNTLANQRVTGLWLTRITIAGNDISLTGGTLTPRNVADLVNRLANEETFRGRYFDDLSIYRPEQENSFPGALEFRASTITTDPSE